MPFDQNTDAEKHLLLNKSTIHTHSKIVYTHNFVKNFI